MSLRSPPARLRWTSRSFIEEKRLSGSFSRQRMTMASISAETRASGLRTLMGGGTSLTWATRVLIPALRSKGTLPAIIS